MKRQHVAWRIAIYYSILENKLKSKTFDPIYCQPVWWNSPLSKPRDQIYLSAFKWDTFSVLYRHQMVCIIWYALHLFKKKRLKYFVTFMSVRNYEADANCCIACNTFSLCLQIIRTLCQQFLFSAGSLKICRRHEKSVSTLNPQTKATLPFTVLLTATGKLFEFTRQEMSCLFINCNLSLHACKTIIAGFKQVKQFSSLFFLCSPSETSG